MHDRGLDGVFWWAGAGKLTNRHLWTLADRSSGQGRFPVVRLAHPTLAWQFLGRVQYGFDGIMSHASSVATLAGPPLAKSVTPMLSSRDG